MQVFSIIFILFVEWFIPNHFLFIEAIHSLPQILGGLYKELTIYATTVGESSQQINGATATGSYGDGSGGARINPRFLPPKNFIYQSKVNVLN